jgi:cyanophycinase
VVGEFTNEVDDIRALTGPNVYSHRPVLSMKFYLDDLAVKESRGFPGFTSTGEFRFMAGNQNKQRKANNGRHNPAGRKAAKNNGRVKSQKANGGSGRPAGSLIAIGGAEDREDTKIILSQIAERIGSRKLVISTLASGYADEVWEIYRNLFTSMGVKRVEHLCLDNRGESSDAPRLDILADATAVFFTGGDQLRITTRLGGTALSERIEEIYRRGGIIAGTSAGATALGEMMLVGSPVEGICRLRDIRIAPGLGLAKNMIIDQHFSERGRIRRLLGAVAENPRMLGIGVDEDTAVVVESDGSFHALGSGAVYVVDGHDLSYTNFSEVSFNRAMSVFGVKLHTLSSGDRFDIHSRQPAHARADVEVLDAESQLLKGAASREVARL